ncbi:MAG: hypothetical protein LBR93_08460 [Treponema sp.]|jgi:beta-glucosidase-like glycosyl hydrolase|nr:hypothetical protein [Treponema sp.]
MTVDLKAKPFFLDEDQIRWVEDTIASMTLEEKIGQLFINLTLRRDPAYIRTLCNKYHIGGVRWQGGTVEEVYEQNRLFQQESKVPLLIAANCESGGNGAIKEGTLVATHAACGACNTPDIARLMGRVAGTEAAAIGCNWTFAPGADILLNWRNTIVNTRAFGSDPDKIIERCKAYMEGIAENGLACCVKHFPGDGVDGRDQHLLTASNDLPCKEWDASFGKVYRQLIDAGLESAMIGHIRLPAYSKKLRPGIRDDELMPASLSPELLTDLLRGQLGFNGLIVTDVWVNNDYYEMEKEHPDPMNRFKATKAGPVEEFKKKHDLALVFINMKGYAQENNVRVRYSVSHSNEMPWYVNEVPTICVSLNYTNHLFDVPMMKTYINAYADTREYIRAVIEKILGKSEFKGVYNDVVWCDRWDTRV